MNKVIGYVVSIVGLVVMALGFGIIPLNIGFLDGVAANYIAGAGIILIVAGVVLSLTDKSSGKAKQAKAQVPIYEGTGKNRKIVGYQKE
jgi:hypothetical protein